MLSKAACTLTVVMSVAFGACGGSSTPTAPSEPAPAPAPPPAPPSTRYALSGTIAEQGVEGAPGDARVAVIDGTNQGRSATADEKGHYSLGDLDAGTFTVRVSAEGFDPVSRSIALTGNQVVDFVLRRATPEPPPPAPMPTVITGIVTDGVTDGALGGVTIRVDGLGETVSGHDGGFAFSADAPSQDVRLVTLSSAVTIERQTRLRVPGPATTLSLMPRSVDLPAFDQMFRSGGVLHRWTSAPPIVIQTRVLKFSSLSDPQYTATAETMTHAEVDGLIADLQWGLPQLTGNTFTAFSDIRVETAAEGEQVPVMRLGWILVARYEGLADDTSFWGYTRWAWNSRGEMQVGILMLDHSFDSSGSPFRRSLRTHELGHALGYAHVTSRTSVMNVDARSEPNDFDRNGAKLAFQRPPLNRSPDIDPDPFTTNLRGAFELFWNAMK